MFKFGKNRKNLKFFNRRKNNFADRLTSYLSIRILGRQLAGKMQAKCRQLAGKMQAVGRQNAGSWQAKCRQLAGSWQAVGRQLAGN